MCIESKYGLGVHNNLCRIKVLKKLFWGKKNEKFDYLKNQNCEICLSIGVVNNFGIEAQTLSDLFLNLNLVPPHCGQ